MSAGANAIKKKFDWWSVKQCADYAREHLPGISTRTIRAWIKKECFSATLVTLRTYAVDPESFKEYIAYRIEQLPACMQSGS